MANLLEFIRFFFLISDVGNLLLLHKSVLLQELLGIYFNVWKNALTLLFKPHFKSKCYCLPKDWNLWAQFTETRFVQLWVFYCIGDCEFVIVTNSKFNLRHNPRIQGCSQKCHNLNFLHLFVAFLQESHFIKGIKEEIISVRNKSNFHINSCWRELI